MDIQGEKRREAWLDELSEFIVEGHKEGWDGKGEKVESVFPGMKCLYYRHGGWEYRDNYLGYFRAPGFIVVSQNQRLVWTMNYFGRGQTPGYEHLAKPTFDFLKRALMRVTPDMPFRGPREYKEGEWNYSFKNYDPKMSVENFFWEEDIIKDKVKVFSQTGGGGTIIGKDKNKESLYPWDI